MGRMNDPASDPRRRLPAVDKLMAHPRLSALLGQWSHRAVLAVCRAELQRHRVGAADNEPANLDRLAACCAQRLERLERPRPQRVVNATGVIVHTNLGRAPLDHAAADLAQVAAGYAALEFDLETGERGRRQDHVADILELVFPDHAALVVNNNAAALLLVLNTFALGREVVISRGELVEIGGSFRVPEILERSGGRLHEVGTTNRTHLRDYEAALSPAVALLLKVWPSNYRVVGFTKEVGVAELAPVARKAGVPLVVDQGCGRLFAESPGPAAELPVEELLNAGADLVCFSADKLLGGPQAGLIVGAADRVARCAKNPLMRALRPDKLTLSALAATLRTHLRRDPAAHNPIARRLVQTERQLQQRAEALAAAVRAARGEIEVSVVTDVSRVGGGAAPEEDLPTTILALQVPGYSPDRLLAALRESTIPIIARRQQGRLWLDLRTIDPSEENWVVQALVSLPPA